MTNITASCPKCSTQYELTEEQLSVAAGQVRCGACMTVFKAIDNAKVPELTPEIDDDALISDTGLHDASDLISDTGTHDAPIADTGMHDAQKLNDALTEELTNISKEDIFDVNEIEQEASLDEDWADQLLAEQNLEDAKREEEEAKEAERAERIDRVKKQQAHLEEVERAELHRRINLEPLELQMRTSSRFWGGLIYSFIAVALIACLGAQYIYFNYDDIARDNKWRAYVETACADLHCHVPDQYNIDDLSAQFLTVTPHDLYKRTLVVETILTNHAKISQPFPVIELFFTNTKQKVVAARRFSSDEYLRGELSSNALMPSRQPIRVALEIDDPGKQASGYFVQLNYVN